MTLFILFWVLLAIAIRQWMDNRELLKRIDMQGEAIYWQQRVIDELHSIVYPNSTPEVNEVSDKSEYARISFMERVEEAA